MSGARKNATGSKPSGVSGADKLGHGVLLYGHIWRVAVSAEPARDSTQMAAESPGAYDTQARAAPGSPETAPWCIVIGGPNGAGKTTFALEYLPQYADCREFVNPDLIAAGVSPLNPQAATVRAGRLVLERIREVSARGVSFGFETTFSGRGHLATLARLRAAGYRVCVILVWVSDLDLCTARIACRVRAGGHHVTDADLRRRFPRVIANLPRYRALADRFLLVDNTGSEPVLVYEKSETGIWTLGDERSFSRIREEVGL